MFLIRFLGRTTRNLFILYLVAFCVAWFARGYLIYPFDPRHETPAQAGEPRLVEKTLTTQDDQNLVVWVKAANGTKPTVLYFHGNAGNLAGRAQRFDRLIDRGYGVVAMAYRGSSGSTGRPSEDNITADSLALYQALPTLLGQMPKGKIIYYGESLGTGVATKLATKHPPAALILEAPYRSIVELASKQMPMFPINAVLDHRWETYKHITSVTSPTLVLHGTNDRVIPIDHGKSIYDLSPAKNKRFKALQGGSHLSGFSVEGQKTIYAFINGL